VIIVQWDLRKVPMEWLAEHGWQYVRHVNENWVEMRLGEEQ